MADSKVSALTAITDPQHDELLYVVRDPSGTPTQRKSTVRSLTRGFGHNALQIGCKGSANYSVGGGDDDSNAIEDFLGELKASGGDSYGVVPGNRTYRWTRKLQWPTGVVVTGLGGYDGAQETPPTFVWDGDHGETGFEIQSSNQNIFMTSIRNMAFTSKASGNKLGTAFKFIATGGAPAKLDSGTSFEDVWVLLTSSHAIDIDTKGSTNFVWRKGRFDAIGGYGIYVRLGGSGRSFIMRGESMTWQGGAGINGMGLMCFDGETATANGDGLSFVTIDGLHTEVNHDLVQTYAAGTNPYDKRGIFRFGVNPSLGTLQHLFKISGWHNSHPGGIASYSACQVTATSGTASAARDKVCLIIDQAQTLSGTNTGEAGTTDECRPWGGLLPTDSKYPWPGNYQHVRLALGTGPDSTGPGARSWEYHRDGANAVRSIGTVARTVSQLDAFPVGPCGYVQVNDCTSTTLGITPVGGGSHKMLVWYNGSAWRTIAVVN